MASAVLVDDPRPAVVGSPAVACAALVDGPEVAVPDADPVKVGWPIVDISCPCFAARLVSPAFIRSCK